MIAAVDQARRERLEIDFWRDDSDERPGAPPINKLLLKFADACRFVEATAPYRNLFRAAGTMLEIGGGQCWASCIIKAKFPEAHVTASDISPDAVASVSLWENVFGVRLDGQLSCKSYSVPLPEQSVDLIFAFQAAHHFGAQAETLQEARRLLKPRGTLLYLHEPACGEAMYPLALKRVNARRPIVREDLLIPARLRRAADEAGLVMTVRPTQTLRVGLARNVYYAALGAAPVLRRVLPCATDFVFSKARV